MLNTRQFNNNIGRLLERRKAAVYAICLRYAAKALNYFRRQQSGEAYWKNQTHQAKDRMFSGGFKESDIYGWFMAHGVEYGIELELGNNGRNEAIKPVIDHFKADFFADIGKLYHD